MSSLLGQVHWEGFVVCLVLFARKGLPGVVCLVVFATSGPNFCLGCVELFLHGKAVKIVRLGLPDQVCWAEFAG